MVKTQIFPKRHKREEKMNTIILFYVFGVGIALGIGIGFEMILIKRKSHSNLRRRKNKGGKPNDLHSTQ